MTYNNICSGTFLERPNRFIANILIDDNIEVCHVKNTGRCKELLPKGASVWCQRSNNPNRKTKFDLISVKKNDFIINMDSQAPNIAVREWLESGGLGTISQLKAEVTHEDSRFDFSFIETDGIRAFMEVKGVTLEENGICRFPDAPTERGSKHLNGLIRASQNGFHTYILFVIQMSPVKYLVPNDVTDPIFSNTLRVANKSGVNVLAVDCNVTPESMRINNFVQVKL